MPNMFALKLATDYYRQGMDDALAGKTKDYSAGESYFSGYNDAKRLYPKDCKINHEFRADIATQRDNIVLTLQAIGKTRKIYAVKLYRSIFDAGLLEAKLKIEES